MQLSRISERYKTLVIVSITLYVLIGSNQFLISWVDKCQELRMFFFSVLAGTEITCYLFLIVVYGIIVNAYRNVHLDILKYAKVNECSDAVL